MWQKKSAFTFVFIHHLCPKGASINLADASQKRIRLIILGIFLVIAKIWRQGCIISVLDCWRDNLHGFLPNDKTITQPLVGPTPICAPKLQIKQVSSGKEKSSGFYWLPKMVISLPRVFSISLTLVLMAYTSGKIASKTLYQGRSVITLDRHPLLKRTDRGRHYFHTEWEK